MKENTRIPFLAGRLSEATSTFILESLKREGMGELLPCHGDILHVLTEQETATVMELSRLTHEVHRFSPRHEARRSGLRRARALGRGLTCHQPEAYRKGQGVHPRVQTHLLRTRRPRDALAHARRGPIRRSAPRENPQRLFIREVRLRPSGHLRRAFRPDLNHSPALIFAKIDGRPPRFDPLRAQRRKPLQNSV